MSRRSSRRTAGGTSVARRRLLLESLEPRLPLDGSPVVGDSTFVLYDSVEVATLPTDFSRNATTLDAAGNIVAADEQRFGDQFAYSPNIKWESLEASFLPQEGEDFDVSTFGSGWDHDGVTPLVVFRLGVPELDLVIARGHDFQEVGRIPLLGDGSIAEFEDDRQYAVRAAIVHEGLIVFAAERQQDFGNGMEAVGVDFFATQDYGLTFEKVPVVGGLQETPGIPESRGINRLAQWSFMNPFPVNGLDDTDSVWFPWADYYFKDDDPKGGQIGLFRADRSNETGLWEFSPNRVIYETWQPEDTGGFHSHSAAITDGGLISHWGDVAYRSVTMFHQFDLENYETASITTVDSFGSFSTDPEITRSAPQPAAVAPSPIPGEHIATGDETPDPVLTFGSLSSVDDKLEVRSDRYLPRRFSRGGVHDGPAILHIDWQRGGGYVIAGRVDPYFYYSRDGENWSEINSPLEDVGRIWFLGTDKLFAVRDDRLYLADAPSVELVRPLQIEPGGTNRVNSTLEERSAPGQGNSLRKVEYSQGLWRYTDSQVPLDVQPDAPNFHGSVPVYEVTQGAESNDLGSWWLMPEGQTISTRPKILAEAQVLNLSNQGVRIAASLGVEGPSGGTSAPDRYHRVADNTQWVNIDSSALPELEIDERAFVRLGSQVVSPGSRYLLALPYLGNESTSPYSIAPGDSAPDEIAKVDGFSLEDHWSVGLVGRWPEDAQMLSPVKMPIASLTGLGDDAIEFSIDYSRGRSRFADIVVDVYDNAQSVDQYSFEFDILRGDSIEFALSRGPVGLIVSATIAGSQIFTSEPLAQSLNLTLDDFAWTDRNGDTQAGIEPILFYVNEDNAWSVEDQTSWLRSSLADKAVWAAEPSPGDFNLDGVVDLLDFELWSDTKYVPNPGGPGDANDDGYVDAVDALIWSLQFGEIEVPAADVNRDGVVDQLDADLITQMIGDPLPPRPGDANRDGIVDFNDHQIFVSEFGQSGADLRSDFNEDGVVNIQDYTIWGDNQGQVYPDDVADVNRDGVIDQLDLDAWASSAGQEEIVLESDFNDDGVVDIADYTVWRDNSDPQVDPGTGADADENGYVEDADALIWIANQGVTYPTLDDLRAQALASSLTVPALATAENTDSALESLFSDPIDGRSDDEQPRRHRAERVERSMRSRAVNLLLDLHQERSEQSEQETRASVSEASTPDPLRERLPGVRIRRPV